MIKVVQAAGQAGDPEIPSPPRDLASFRAFYLARQKKMMGFVRVQTAGLGTDPEAVAQEGWCKFFPHWEDCQHPDAYLRQCMVTAAADAMRKALSEPRAAGPDAGPVLDSLESGLHRLPANREDPPMDPMVTAALQRLSPKLREFVLLEIELELGERPVAEIARILGIARGAAYARRKRAHDEIRRLLPPDYLEQRTARRREGWSTP